jgi:hypothetical protein
MKKFLIAAAIAFSSSFSYAQTRNFVEVEKTVYCMDSKRLLKYLIEDLKERVIMLGQADDKTTPVGVAVLYNRAKDTFSVIEFNDNIGCLITSGDTVELSFPDNFVRK